MFRFFKHSRRWHRIRRFPARFYEWLTSTGGRFVQPIEDLFSAIGKRLFSFNDELTGVESIALGVGRLFLWPIQLLRRAASSFFSLLVPERAKVFAGRRYRALARRARPVMEFAAKIAQALNLDRAAIWLAKVAKPIWYPIVAVCSFAQAWINSRRYKRLALTVPVVALLSLLPLMKGWMWYRGNETAAARYRAAVATAQEEKDYNRVQLFERKLSQLGQDTRLAEYNTALLLERDGKTAEAYERMQRLAPLNAPGYPLAHYWIIQRLLQKKLDVPTDKAYELVGNHLTSLEKTGVKGPEIDLVQANVYAHDNNLEEASRLLKPLIYRNKAAAFERLRIDLSQNRIEDARQDATAVREQMQKQNVTAESLSAQDYHYWMMAEEILGNSDRARELLAKWIKLDPENDAAKKQLGATYLREFQAMLSSPQPVAADLAERIKNAFELADQPDAVKEQLSIMYQQKFTSDVLAELFDRLYNTPNLAPPLAELLGTAAAVSGEWDRAESWLRQSIAGNPNNPAVWNNLACVLLQHSNPPLDEALAAAEKAIASDTSDFRFRQTRGQILLRLGRYQDAVNDLEYALNGMPDLPTIHQSLAKAYDALGNRQLAAFHQLNAN